MKRLIIFLVRKHLGLKKYEHFKFANQSTDAVYYFTDVAVMKIFNGYHKLSSVSLNWLLNDNCEVVPVE